MKNRKMIVLLLVGILLLSIANLLTVIDGESKGKIVRNITLMSLSAEVTSLRIERRGHQPVLIAKSSKWRLVEPYAADVDEQKVLRLLDALSQTLVMDSIADSQLLRLGRRRADFELDEPLLRLHVASGEKHIGYLFGSFTPSGDGVYAAVEGLNTVFVMPAALMSALDVPADGFRRRTLFGETPHQLESLAARAHTITYELLCLVTARIPRIYPGAGPDLI